MRKMPTFLEAIDRVVNASATEFNLFPDCGLELSLFSSGEQNQQAFLNNFFHCVYIYKKIVDQI